MRSVAIIGTGLIGTSIALALQAKGVDVLLGDRDRDAVDTAVRPDVSAGTLAETLIVSTGRNIGGEMARLLDRISPDIIPVTADAARRIGETYQRWGRGMHPASLNFGDCFAYALAKERACRLLYVGEDFAKTDVESVL